VKSKIDLTIIFLMLFCEAITRFIADLGQVFQVGRTTTSKWLHNGIYFLEVTKNLNG